MSTLAAPLRAVIGWVCTVPILMLGHIAFRSESLGVALQMYAKLLVPRQYLILGLRENTYVVAAIVMIGIFVTYGTVNVVLPFLRRNRFTWFLAQATVYGLLIAIVFTYLRPNNQFIYFQF